jgi:hypothetical protein
VGGGADWGTTVEMVECTGATSTILSAILAKLVVSISSAVEAKIS